MGGLCPARDGRRTRDGEREASGGRLMSSPGRSSDAERRGVCSDRVRPDAPGTPVPWAPSRDRPTGTGVGYLRPPRPCDLGPARSFGGFSAVFRFSGAGRSVKGGAQRHRVATRRRSALEGPARHGGTMGLTGNPHTLPDAARQAPAPRSPRPAARRRRAVRAVSAPALQGAPDAPGAEGGGGVAGVKAPPPGPVPLRTPGVPGPAWPGPPWGRTLPRSGVGGCGPRGRRGGPPRRRPAWRTP
ncbi:hypothetical protein BCL76_11133 [Streptomyces sp. CG 926]|nr:hypothetical protein BCL76_11133 [Streptomyces sp. CG 926]